MKTSPSIKLKIIVTLNIFNLLHIGGLLQLMNGCWGGICGRETEVHVPGAILSLIFFLLQAFLAVAIVFNVRLLIRPLIWLWMAMMTIDTGYNLIFRFNNAIIAFVMFGWLYILQFVMLYRHLVSKKE